MPVNTEIKARVFGQVDQSGRISITCEVSEIGYPNEVWQVNYSAGGTINPASGVALGNADFSYSCASGQDNLLWCVSKTSDSFTGTILWTFLPNP